MDFKLPPREEAFREEVREFLKKELPPDWKGTWGLGDETDDEVERPLQKKLAQKGWLTLAWPRTPW